MTRRELAGRGLFALGVLLASALVALVVVSPFVESDSRIVTLFAQDAGLRRTCLASAGGLVVTACVFFRSGRGRPVGRTKPPIQRPRSSRMAGA